MLGSYSKAELMKTLDRSALSLVKSPHFPRSVSGPLQGIFFSLHLSLSLSFLLPLLSPFTAPKNNALLSFKYKNLCRLQLVNKLMTHFWAIRILKIEEKGSPILLSSILGPWDRST